jgi:GT2 family glycosyltransferase
MVFSKDRPLQLDAALQSFNVATGGSAADAIRVLYLATSPSLSASYRVLHGEHPKVGLRRESAFKVDLISLVEGSSQVMFVVDDTLFVNQFSLERASHLLERDESLLGFSFRLGRNTTYCYSLDRAQPLPVFEEPSPGVLTYDWTAAESDFGYPLELSSSLYRTADILPLLGSLPYTNPNTLESLLAQHLSDFRHRRPALGCFAQSVAVSVPANIVQNVWANRAATDPTRTAEALLEAYKRGQRLEVDRYSGFVSTAAHEELEFTMRTDPSVPTVSVIIPCYEQANLLPDAVHSVVGQTFGDWEIVIVDDGSPDATADVARALANEFGDRIHLVQRENGGLSAARNEGICAARGRYVLPLDADDVLEPAMLERAVAVLDHDPSVAIVYTDLQQFGEGSVLIRAAEFDAELLPGSNQLSYCAMYRREVWEAVGGYNSNMKWGYEDWDFWIGAVEQGYRAKRIPEPLFRYRVRKGGMFARALEHDVELRRQLALNHPSSFGQLKRLRRRLRARFGSNFGHLATKRHA